jgi:hypothetical protein
LTKPSESTAPGASESFCSALPFTAAVTEQFKQTVADQSNQIADLKKQLATESERIEKKMFSP